MNKILVFLLIIFSSAILLANDDPIKIAIENADDKKIVEIINYCRLMKKNRKDYEKCIQDKLQELDRPNKNTKLNQVGHFVKGAIYGGLAGVAFLGSKRVFQEYGTCSNALVGLAFGTALGAIGVNQLYKAFRGQNSKDRKFYKTLAICKELNDLEQDKYQGILEELSDLDEKLNDLE